MKNLYILLTILLAASMNAQHYEGTPMPGSTIIQHSLKEVEPSGLTTMSATQALTAGTPTGNSQFTGVIKGELSVSLSGGASYNVPFTVPPGINKVVPQVGLAYNSQGGNGIAGYGWEIYGISSITRVPSTTHHDSKIDPVDFDNLDRYSMDGQRLMLKSGTYGASGSIYETEAYSNVKITAYGVSMYGGTLGPNYFLVENADGSKAYYGNSLSSQGRETWYITSWENAQGVRIDYIYLKDDNNNDIRISKIRYGTNAANTFLNEIEFVYSSRYRPEQRFIGGASFFDNQILRQVNIKAQDMTYRNYLLSHNITDLGYQRLTSITEGVGSQYLNPTLFTYDDTSSSISYSSGSATIPELTNIASNNARMVPGDYDGDGRMDFIIYATSGEFNKNKYWLYTDVFSQYPMVSADNSSGAFAEIFSIKNLLGDYTYGHKLSPAEGWAVVQPQTSQLRIRVCSGLSAVSPISLQYDKIISNTSLGGNVERNYYSGDFNGDGLTDVVAVVKATGQIFFINLDKTITSTFSNPAGYLTEVIGSSDRVIVGDHDGDGKSELIHFQNGKFRVYTMNENNSTFSVAVSVSSAYVSTSVNIMPGDYNGDGKMDFIIPRGSGYDEYRVFTSNGLGYTIAVQIFSGITYAVNNSLNSWYYIPNDYNNDGKTDLLLYKASGAVNGSGNVTLTCYLNKAGTFSHQAGNYLYVSSGTQAGIDAYTLPVFLDPDQSNANLELACVRNSKITYFKSSKDFAKEKLLRTITNGNGVTETISYSPLVNNCNTPGCVSAYTSDAYAENYPNFDVTNKPNFYVVSQLEKQSTDHYKKQTYRYKGAVINYKGLGFIGFKSILKTNWYENNAEVISNVIINDISKRGALTENIVVAGWGSTGYSPSVFLQKSVYGYQAQTLANKVYKLSNTTLSTTNQLEGTSHAVSNTYDAYNNITATSFTKSGTTTEQTGTTTYEYLNSTSSPYYIGRLSKVNTSVTHNGATMTTEELNTYGANQLVSQKKKKGHLTDYITEDYTYDTFGNITETKISAPGYAVRTATTTYTPSGIFVTQSKDIKGLVTNFGYDYTLSGFLWYITDPQGKRINYNYDAFGKVTEKEDYNGNVDVTSYTKQGSNDITSESYFTGRSEYTQYDDLGRPVVKGLRNVDGSWSYIKTEYDKHDRVVSVSQPYATLGGIPSQFSTTSYDLYGRILQTVEHTGKVTNYTYSGLSTVENDGANTKTTVRNSAGYITSVQDNGGTIDYQYYPNGKLKQSNYGGYVISIEQDGWGNRKKLVDPSAGTFTYQYNPFSEIIEEISPKGTRGWIRNSNGNVQIEWADGDGENSSTFYSYFKGMVKRKERQTADGAIFVIDNTFDSVGRLTVAEEVTPEATFRKSYQYNSYGQMFKETLYADNVGNDGGGGQTNTVVLEHVYQYGHKLKTLDFETQQLLYENTSVNSRMQVTSAKYGNNLVANNTFDQYGFPTQVKYGSVLTQNTVFEPQHGTLTSRNTLMGTFTRSESFGYDAMDRLTQFTNNNGVQEQQVYDDRGRISSNAMGSYTYNSTNYRHTATEISTAGLAYYSNRMGIFFRGMEDRKGWTTTFPNTVTYDSSKSKTGSYSLRLNGSSFQNADADSWVNINNDTTTQYTFSGWVYSDGPGVRLYLCMQDESQLGTGTFSTVYKSEVTTGQWTYMTLTVPVAATVKRLSIRVHKTGAGYVWFDDIRISRNAVDNGIRELNIDYNMFKAPMEISETGVDRISFDYNADRTRSVMYYGNTNSDKLERPFRKYYSADGTIEVKYDVVNDAYEYTTYIGGNPYSAPVLHRRRENTSGYYFLLRDYMGSILAITNQSGGVVEKRMFDAWGNLFKAYNGTGEVISGMEFLDRGYTGHEHLQTVALINMNGRLYDPTMHRFLQPDNHVQDPQNTQNYNRYGYVYNNPLKYNDQSGEFLGSILTAIGSAIGNFIQHGVNFNDYNWDRLENSWKIDMGLFKGNFGQILSKWTWGSINTVVGNLIGHGANAVGLVRDVTYLEGAVAIAGLTNGEFEAFTVGPYIFGPKDFKADWRDHLFVHEYGHYIQN
ncbi:MAG: hypothetical protein DI539_11520, partial [Flavobacterium psychrophilum]